MLLIFAAHLLDTFLCRFRARCFWRPGYHVVQLCAGPKKRIGSVSACAAFTCRLALDLLPCLLMCLKVSPHTAMNFRETTSRRLQLRCMHRSFVHGIACLY